LQMVAFSDAREAACVILQNVRILSHGLIMSNGRKLFKSLF